MNGLQTQPMPVQQRWRNRRLGEPSHWPCSVSRPRPDDAGSRPTPMPSRRATGGRSVIIDSPQVDAATFLRNVVDSHRSVSFELIPSDDQQEIWQWVVMLAIVVFVVAIIFY